MWILFLTGGVYLIVTQTTPEEANEYFYQDYSTNVNGYNDYSDYSSSGGAGTSALARAANVRSSGLTGRRMLRSRH